MNYTKIFSVIFALAALIVFESCEEKDPDVPKKTTKFSGEVIEFNETAVADAVVSINGAKTTTSSDGSFSIEIELTESFLVSVEKFGYGLYSKSFNEGFSNKKIILTKGTVIEFDPTIDNELVDTNSDSSIMKSSLLDLDTALLFKIIPKVYDHTGKLVDLGYPPGAEGIFDYVKKPINRRPGMRVNLRGNTLRNANGNVPPAGTKLRASISTVDFFNPDGMPGDFSVRFQGDPKQFDSIQKRSGQNIKMSAEQTEEAKPKDPDQDDDSGDNQMDDQREQLAFMESYGAGTIEITDGTESYNLADGETATVTIPVYEIRKIQGEELPSSIPLLHYNETNGVWEVTGVGSLNDSRDAYVGEVGHFSVVNFDAVKTGDSKCFKIRQMLVNGANSNTADASYRAKVIIPQSATSTFDERQRDIVEGTGCVNVDGTDLHAVTRIPDGVPYVATVFSQGGSGATDTLDIVFVNSDPVNSIPAETAVAAANDCATACDTSVLDCSTATDANNYGTSPCNTPCWLPNCPTIPFDNSGAIFLKVVGIPMGGGQVKVEWVSRHSGIQAIELTVHDATGCNSLFNSGDANPLQSSCNTGCFGNSCNGGEIIYNGPVGSTVYFNIKVTPDITCTDNLVAITQCSDAVTIL